MGCLEHHQALDALGKHGVSTTRMPRMAQYVILDLISANVPLWCLVSDRGAPVTIFSSNEY